MPPLVVALFLAAHGLVHASYASPEPRPSQGGPAWPFHLDRSWLLTPLGLDAAAIRVIGLALVALVVAGYAASALAVLGVLPGSWFVPVTAGASVASIVLLTLFFTPWIVLGLVIDAALLAGVVAAGWLPGAVG